jgi:Tfp pilus assembly protein FimT
MPSHSAGQHKPAATPGSARQGSAGHCGFSLLELSFVVAVSMVLVAIAVPAVSRAVHMVRLQESAIDYASLLQRARMRAVQDDRYYSVWVQTAAGNNPPIAYVDVYPQNANGTSGRGNPTNGGSYNAGPPSDPMVLLSSEVTMQPVANAPGAAVLDAAFCNACVAAGSAALILNSGPTWGPNGLPCRPTTSVGLVGTVCNAAGGPAAYVTYFQSSVTQAWGAVTVTPAGRVQIWTYSPNNNTWSTH